jgi:hypothetical protein
VGGFFRTRICVSPGTLSARKPPAAREAAHVPGEDARHLEQDFGRGTAVTTTCRHLRGQSLSCGRAFSAYPGASLLCGCFVRPGSVRSALPRSPPRSGCGLADHPPEQRGPARAVARGQCEEIEIARAVQPMRRVVPSLGQKFPRQVRRRLSHGLLRCPEFSQDQSSTEHSPSRPSTMRRPNSQQPSMANSSVG